MKKTQNRSKTETAQKATQIDEQPKTQEGPFVIPMSVLPMEMKYLSKGRHVGLKVQGRFTGEGVEVASAELMP